MNWYLEALRKYAVFGGRARRKEYWFFILFNIIFAAVLAVIDWITGTYNVETGIGLLGTLYALAVFIPGISVLVRRLHDTDRSGWWFWIVLIPLIGWIWIFVLLVLEGTSGQNQYGSDPKA